jgi:protein SCO1/2
VTQTAAPSSWPAPRIIAYCLGALLAAVVAIPLSALWGAFGPYSHRAPDFTLTNQDNRPFRLSAQVGRPVVLFFGYTHCPDVCPTTLSHLAQAIRQPSVPYDIEVVFVTVDAERDSPSVLKRYVRLFNPSFVGLTGRDADLEPVYSDYRVTHQAFPAHHGKDGYSVAHGTTIFYIGRDGSLKAFGSWDDSIATIAYTMQGM